MPFSTNFKTITRHIQEKSLNNPKSNDLNQLLTAIITAIKQISVAVSRAGIEKFNELAEINNASGDNVKKLDVISNDIMINFLKASFQCCALISEENENAIIVENDLSDPKNPVKSGKYVVCFDPLDGSGNIDCLVAIGTIFSIFECPLGTSDEKIQEFVAQLKSCKDGNNNKNELLLLPGNKMVAAGYSIYGSGTSLVLSTGDAPDIYTLDPACGDFILTNEAVKIRPRGKYYSLNEGYTQFWDGPITDYIAQCKQPPANPKKPMVCRYIGSMVADIHRTLLYGGIFMNPGHLNAENKLRLKLRYLYEVAPMAFLMEKAGGLATTGMERILDVKPDDIHFKISILMGSSENVQDLLDIIKKYGKDHLQGTRFH